MHNTPFTDMNDSEGEVQQAGYGAFESGTRVIKLLSAFIPALSINSDKVRENIDTNCITVTELADTLVRKECLSFRQAHEIAAITSRDVIQKSEPLANGYDAFRVAFKDQTDRFTNLSEDAYKLAVSPENFIAVRTRYGGPALAPMDIALSEYSKDLSRQKGRASKNETYRIQSENVRLSAFSRLTNNEGGT